MKQTILCMMLCLNCGLLHAQTPQYMFSSWSGTGANAAWSFSSNEGKIQSLYYPTDFPGMPRGTINNLYLRAYPVGSPTLDNITYHNVKVSIGYTADSSYTGVGGYYTFKTGLTTIFNVGLHPFSGVKPWASGSSFPS